MQVYNYCANSGKGVAFKGITDEMNVSALLFPGYCTKWIVSKSHTESCYCLVSS